MKRGQQQYVTWEIPCRQASLWILSISRRPAWGLLAFVALISGIGTFLQMEISRQLGDGTSYMDGTQYVFFVMTGIVLMSIVQYVDYTRIAAYAKWIGAAILLVGGYAVLFGSMANGSLYYITIGSYHISSPFWDLFMYHCTERSCTSIMDRVIGDF